MTLVSAAARNWGRKNNTMRIPSIFGQSQSQITKPRVVYTGVSPFDYWNHVHGLCMYTVSLLVWFVHIAVLSRTPRNITSTHVYLGYSLEYILQSNPS